MLGTDVWTVYVVDNFEMLDTDSRDFVTKILKLSTA